MRTLALTILAAGLALIAVGTATPIDGNALIVLSLAWLSRELRSQSPAVRPEPAAAGIDVTAAAGHPLPIGATR